MHKKTGSLFLKLFLLLFSAIITGLLVGPLVFLVTGYLPPTPPFKYPTLVPLAWTTITSLFLALAIAWYVVKPLRHIKKALMLTGQEKFDMRIAPILGSRNDEIGELAQQFDTMADRLQQMTQARRLLFHDVSHELRSPLHRIEIATNIIRQTPEKQTPMLDRIEQEVKRLDNLVEEILTIERTEWEFSKTCEMVDVIEILYDISEDASFEAETKNCTIKTNISGSFTSYASPELLYRALENIIRNAVKYSPDNSTITISSTVNTDHAVLTISVADQGCGVEEKHIPYIFEPFFRIPGTAQTTRGFGLGLAMSQRIVSLLKGSIEAHNNSNGGLTMSINLPRLETIQMDR